ncbi:hypothetical protein PTKIN_Ptkin11bG0057300 [Pterospermum kingtungense]
MGEMLLGNFKGDIPLVIILPSMIVSTYKEPFPGWIEGVRTIDSVIASYGKGELTCFPGNPNSAFDVIPADMVVSAMVVATVKRNGHRVKIGKATVFSKADRFFLYMKIKYVLPVKVLYLVNILSFQNLRKVYKDIDRKIKFIMRLAEFYKPYVFFKGIFGDTNLEKLRIEAEERDIDMGVFNFDSMSIDWEDYIVNIHIPGLLRRGMKY